MPEQAPPPKRAIKAGAAIVAIIAFIIVSIFIGFNLYHFDTQQELQSGHIDPRDAPKSPTDLQAPPEPRAVSLLE